MIPLAAIKLEESKLEVAAGASKKPCINTHTATPTEPGTSFAGL
jgi:hypothetical protein